MTIDPWALYRAALDDALRNAAAADGLSHAELVRQQLEADAGEDSLPALLCLRLGQVLCGNPSAALAPSTALALLTQMARVFLGLESQGGAPSLSTAWGMPRVLNAGDAFYALAQDALLLLDDEIPAAERLRALDTFDGAVRGYVEALHAAPGENQLAAGQQALLPAAVTLAGIYAGADGVTMAELRRLGESLGDADAGSLEADLLELTKTLAAKPAPPRG